jgi:hypothetical protein
MAYNCRNKLQRIVEIQTITLEHTKRGVSQVWIFNNLINPRFFISESTYYNYLGMNAKKSLAEYEKQRSKQLELF